ncbi:DnaJ domain protein [Opisthorchis viverrini]|uniref:DnaJ domain protein n=1 Tax=Opisthorchis viverrini TaxID=6198 RepID=A0A1S8X2P4_OPIVI|nr:DnaJ domain protein [Opisthorchis viverrini]
MDANKDEALRCVSMARARLSAGQTELARRYVMKAVRLYPGVSIAGLESLVCNSRSQSRERASTVNRDCDSSQNVSNPPPPEHSEAVFTRAQAEAVRKVLACKDYYELLGVTKDSSEDVIRRSYKSLALKFHPDKNRAPGATEAFKKIGTALSVLTDPEKRRRYDQYGTEEEQVPRITRVHRHGDPFFQYDGDVFTMFFNGGFPFSQVYRGHHQRPHSRESERENNYFVYVQLVPLLLIFALSFFSNFFIRESHYSLTRSNKYSVERLTSSHNVPFYVKPSFTTEFDGHLGRLEAQVEEEYANNLRFRCFREREYMHLQLSAVRVLKGTSHSCFSQSFGPAFTPLYYVTGYQLCAAFSRSLSSLRLLLITGQSRVK